MLQIKFPRKKYIIIIKVKGNWWSNSGLSKRLVFLIKLTV